MLGVIEMNRRKRRLIINGNTVKVVKRGPIRCFLENFDLFFKYFDLKDKNMALTDEKIKVHSKTQRKLRKGMKV